MTSHSVLAGKMLPEMDGLRGEETLDRQGTDCPESEACWPRTFTVYLGALLSCEL